MGNVDEPEVHILGEPQATPSGMRPIIMQRGGRYFCVTQYYATAGGSIMSEEMWDITDQLQDLVEISAMSWIAPENRQN